MKRVLFLIPLFAMLNMTVWAGEDVMIAYGQLPEAGRGFISEHFNDIGVSYVKMERELAGRNYTVVFVTGEKIEFDRHGNWTDMEFRHSLVPQPAVPPLILEHVRSRMPDANITEMEKGRFGFEVKLDNGTELIFDRNFTFLGIDD